MEVLKFRANADIVAVQYKGVGPIYTALLASEIDAAFMPTSQSLGHISGGKLRALATGSPQRRRSCPRTDRRGERVSRVRGHQLAGTVRAGENARAHRSEDSGGGRAGARCAGSARTHDCRWLRAIGSTPEAFDAKVRAEVARYAQVVKDARIPPLD